jgi:hypothetical protein
MGRGVMDNEAKEKSFSVIQNVNGPIGDRNVRQSILLNLGE